MDNELEEENLKDTEDGLCLEKCGLCLQQRCRQDASGSVQA